MFCLPSNRQRFGRRPRDDQSLLITPGNARSGCGIPPTQRADPSALQGNQLGGSFDSRSEATCCVNGRVSREHHRFVSFSVINILIVGVGGGGGGRGGGVGGDVSVSCELLSYCRGSHCGCRA